ncbi:KpsF/GutQ family sugar-phosphate isomerase [Thermodesulforhabdus norvegica]|uniref:Arabinose-5-phosphate isomerase n=1 Tax=Thermodesulforhabdus norvegica TaxID=39841 RepID=A0A1I4V8K3_9BACT|nr:KpsF/GutQ family sugar-phosphate isomerase [Thermodesulforhabdus norvegica]SFM97494.1 arabinose-5-phosphate isomerase [Thermodesulforhabdus norvegica]
MGNCLLWTKPVTTKESGEDLKSSDLLELAREVLSIEAEGILTVRKRLGKSFEEAIALLLNCKGRVITCGIGKSGIIARKIAATLSSMGTPSFFLHPAEALHGDLGMVRPEDVIIALSNSGETGELNQMIRAVKPLDVKIIAITGDPLSTLAKLSDIVIDVAVPREACSFGLAPTTSTTAALAMGDALAVVLAREKNFGPEEFRTIHPGGHLGQRLKIPVRDLMKTGGDIPLVLPGTSMDKAIEEMNVKGLGATLVVNCENKLLGIFTDGDLRRAITKWGYKLYELVIDEVMTKEPKTISPDSAVADALQIMERHLITVLPVVIPGDQVVGILHLHDLLGKGKVQFRLTD